MTYSLVQHKSGISATNSVTVTLSATGAGNTLIVVASTNESGDGANADLASVTLGGSGTGFASQLYINGDPDNGCISVWADFGIAGGQTSLVVTAGTSDTPVLVDVYEVSGGLTALDKTVTATVNGAGGSWTSGATGTLSQAAEFAVGVAGGYSTAGAFTLTGPGSGWTNETQLTESTYISQLSGYQVTSATGALTYSGTASTASGDLYYMAAVATFKGGGSPHTATASLTAVPALAASGHSPAHVATASHAVTPARTAARARGRYRTASHAVTPALAAVPFGGSATGSAGPLDYQIAVTPASSAAATLAVPAPACNSGDLLVMAAFGGGTTTPQAPATPSGWTAVSSSGAALGVFTRTATSSESAYTVGFAGDCCGVAAVASYPAGTVAASSFPAGVTGQAAYSPAFPSGVTSAQTVLLFGAVMAGTNTTGTDTYSGSAHLQFPGTWDWDVPPAGPAMFSNTGNYLVTSLGLARHQGSTTAPELTSAISSDFYAGYLVLDITGSTPDRLEVTAAPSGGAGIGMSLTVTALAGAASVADIVAAAATATASPQSGDPELAITPAGTGSLIYGAAWSYNPGAGFTAAAGTAFDQNVYDSPHLAVLGNFHSAGTTVRGTPQTLGGTAPAVSYAQIALAEILAAGTIEVAGTALVTATSSGQYTTSASPQQTAIFTQAPPPGSLLVASVAVGSQAYSPATSVTLSDSSGLTWTQLAGSTSSGTGAYAGIWIAAIPGGTAAAVTVTPSFSAGRSHGQQRAAVLAVVPSPAAAAGSFASSRTAAHTVTPAFTATAETNTRTRTAALTITPSLAAGRAHGHARAAALAVTPSLAAAAPGGRQFPQAPLDLTCELDLAGTWTAIPGYVYQRDQDTPVTITRGRPDESSQVNPAAAAFQLNNRDGRFTVKNASGPYFGKLNRNTPVRFSVPAGTTYLRFEDDATSYAACPAAAGLEIAGDIDVRIDIKPASYMPSTLACRYDGGTWSWVWLLLGDGTLQWWWADSGGAFHTATSTAPVPVGRTALRVTLQVSAGTVTFWTAPAISGTWTQLGDQLAEGATSLRGGTSPVQVGYSAEFEAGYGYQGLQGSVYGFGLLSGIGGTAVASPDFTAQAPGVTSFTDAQGNTWTVNGTAEISGRDYRGHFEMSSLPVAWDPSGNDVWVPVAAGGLLRRLGQGDAPLYSAMKRAILDLSGDLAPVAYWPCEDLQGATVIASAINGPPMALSGGAGDGQVTFTGPSFAADSSFLCSDALPTIGTSSWYGTVPAYTSSGSVVVRFLLDPSTAPAAGVRIMRVITTGTCYELSMYSGGTAGVYGLAGYDASGAVFDTGEVTFTGFGSSPVWCSMELQPGTGGTVDYALVLLQPGSLTGQEATGSFTGVIGNATACYVNPRQASCSIGLGHISVQSAWESLFDLYQPLDAWQGETAGNRFARLCAENGFQARIYGPPDTSAPMGAQSAATLTGLLQECETADMGMIYEPRQALALGYRTQASLYNQAPQVTTGYGQAGLGGTGTDMTPAYDDQYTRNDLTVQRSSGNVSGASYRAYLDDGSAMSISPPPAGVGDYSDSQTVSVQADSQLPDTAWWLVHLGTVDDYRWPAVPLNMARAELASIFYDVQDAEIGDFIEITSPPAWLPPDPVKQVICQSAEVLGGFHYTITWSCIPESPYETGIYGDPVYGRADTDGSALAGGVNTTAATLSVATTSAATPIWTTSPADFPFDIAVDGERMTVTGITGSSSPQSFTVTRAVNGVVRTHSAGADVRLWTPPVYAML